MPEPAWKTRPMRMARFDQVDWLASADPQALVEHARQLRNHHINFEWILGDGQRSGQGLSGPITVNFQSDKFPPNPALNGRDPLRRYAPIAHQAGLTVFSYLNMHAFPYEFADQHPEWEQRLASGEAYGRRYPLYGYTTTLCVNSGWRDYAFELIEETMRTGIDGVFLDGPVVYPGCCYCPACQAKFQQRYGARLPVEENWENPAWLAALRFREESMADFLRDARQHVRRVNPEGGVFLNGGNWQFGNAVARNPWMLEAHQDITGAEAFFHLRREDSAYWLDSAMTAKFLRAGNNPAVVFTHHALGVWHYCGLSPYELKRSFYQTAACGANPWFAYFGGGAPRQNEQALQPVKESYGFIEEHENLFAGATSAARVALVHSPATSLAYRCPWVEVQGETYERDLITHLKTESPASKQARKQASERLCSDEFAGFFYLLTRRHVPFDVIRAQDLLSERLAHYDTVILPNAACLSAAEKAALLQVARGGGTVIASFETGQYDEEGKPLQDDFLSELFGVQSIEGAFKPAGFEEYLQVAVGAEQWMPALAAQEILPRYRYALQIKATADALPLCWIMQPVGKLYGPLGSATAYPGLVVKPVGQGRGIYFAGSFGESYQAFGFLQYEQVMADLLRAALGGRPQLLTNAPSTLQMELWQKENQLLLHLVNNSGDMRRPIDAILPLPDLEIRLGGVRAAGVHSARHAPVAFGQAGADLVLRLSLKEQYDILIIDRKDETT